MHILIRLYPATSKRTGERHTKHVRTQVLPAYKNLYPQEGIYMQDKRLDRLTRYIFAYPNLKNTLGRFCDKL